MTTTTTTSATEQSTVEQIAIANDEILECANEGVTQAVDAIDRAIETLAEVDGLLRDYGSQVFSAEVIRALGPPNQKAQRLYAVICAIAPQLEKMREMLSGAQFEACEPQTPR